MQAFNDIADHLMTYPPTVQNFSQRILLCLLPSHPDLTLLLRDIRQDYTQESMNMCRNVFIQPPPGLGIRDDASAHDMCFLFYGEMLSSSSSPIFVGSTCAQTDDTANIGNKYFIYLEEKFGSVLTGNK